MTMWEKYIDYLHTHQRRPSKYNPSDMKLVNWLKHNRKLMNKGTMEEGRKSKFEELLTEAAKYRRVNQHVYVNNIEDKSDDE